MPHHAMGVPFHYGGLAEAIPVLDQQIKGLVQSQQTNGGWVFMPANEQQKDLGQTNDSVQGLVANGR